jgi:hypothetical protein
MFPPTPPYGVQQRPPYGPPPYPPPQQPKTGLLTKIIIGAGLVFALVMASSPVLGVADLLDVFDGWETVSGDAPTTPSQADGGEVSQAPSQSAPAQPPPPRSAAPADGVGGGWQDAGTARRRYPFHRVLTAREWAAFVADPSRHVGEAVMVTGRLVSPPVPGDDTAYAVLGGLPVGGGAPNAVPTVVTGSRQAWAAVPFGAQVHVYGTVAGSRDNPDDRHGQPERLVVLEIDDRAVAPVDTTP